MAPRAAGGGCRLTRRAAVFASLAADAHVQTRRESTSMSEVASKVRSWLEGQGYPLEMAVARAFASKGFGVALSTYYDDPVTRTPRELDVRAVREVSTGRSTARVVVSIECKLAAAHPWILFTSPSGLRLPPDRSPLSITGGGARARLMGILGRPAEHPLSFFDPSCPVGYSVTEAFTTGKDLPYQACMGATAAAASFAPTGFVVGRDMQLVDLSVLAIPVVVISGVLVCASLRPEADPPALEVVEIERGAVLWSHPQAGLTNRLVHIVTFDALPIFLDELDVAAEAFLAPPPQSLGSPSATRI